jgi:beta-carotene 3-hydroxylase
MECIAWFMHKYIMHGLFWRLHQDHHQPIKDRVFEKNDSFFLIFASPAIILILLGIYKDQIIFLVIGASITCYGLCYFLVHDVFIHQRFKWFKHSNNFYLRAIRKAHKVHHKHLDKYQGENFGMLWVPLKYFKAEIKHA